MFLKKKLKVFFFFNCNISVYFKIYNKLTIIIEGEIPPKLRTDEPGPYKAESTFYSGKAPSDSSDPSETRIYVPEGSVKTYQEAVGWEKYENCIDSISDYNP